MQHVPTLSMCPAYRVLRGRRGGRSQVLKIFIIIREAQNNLLVVCGYQPFFVLFLLTALIIFPPPPMGIARGMKIPSDLVFQPLPLHSGKHNATGECGLILIIISNWL